MGQPLGDGEHLLTIADFEKLLQEDSYRVELVRGLLVRTPRPSSLHGRLCARLTHLLYEFVEARGLGAVLVDPGAILSRDPDTVRGPDVAFYTPARIPASAYATAFWGPPDLAVEVLSPPKGATLVREKVADFLGAGVRVVWVVVAKQRTVIAHRPGDTQVFAGDALLAADDVLPGFRLPLQRLFTL